MSKPLGTLLQEWAVPLGVVAVVVGLLHVLILQKAYPTPPGDNRAVVVVTGACAFVKVGIVLGRSIDDPPRSSPSPSFINPPTHTNP
jgi:hypothetical protein